MRVWISTCDESPLWLFPRWLFSFFRVHSFLCHVICWRCYLKTKSLTFCWKSLNCPSSFSNDISRTLQFIYFANSSFFWLSLCFEQNSLLEFKKWIWSCWPKYLASSRKKKDEVQSSWKFISKCFKIKCEEKHRQLSIQFFTFCHFSNSFHEILLNDIVTICSYRKHS